MLEIYNVLQRKKKDMTHYESRHTRNWRKQYNPSGTRCDLLQPRGPEILLKHYYYRHFDVIRDLVKRMGYSYHGVNQCNFCIHRFADRFLSGTPEHDTLWNLVEHHVHHPRKYVDRNPFETMLHILASILSAYVTKGSHNHYQIYRTMIRHDPEGALRLLEGDWYCASPLENKFTAQSLQSFCLRRLLKPFIEEIIKEFAAYVHWYEMYRNYKIMTKQRLHFKFRRSFMLMTRSANMPLYPKTVQAEMNVNPRVAPPDSPESMNTD